jgi:hypothetical protein
MKPIAWYDPSSGAVSTNPNSHLFTPLAQVWPLDVNKEWVSLSDDDMDFLFPLGSSFLIREIVAITEAKLKEKNQ